MPVSPENPAIPAIHALHLAQVAERLGVPAARVLAPSGLDPARLREPGARLSIPEVIALVERAQRLTGEPGIGFLVGLHMRIASHGHVGLAAMSAGTVGEAIAIAVRFAPTRTSAVALRLEEEGERARLVLDLHAELGPARDAFVFALLTGIARIGDALTGLELALDPASHAEVSFAEPPYYARFSELAPRVLFDRKEDCLSFPRSLLDRPLVTGDPATSRLTLEHCERELEALVPRLAARVRAQLPAREGGFRPLAEVARALHVSPRTLKRHLAGEGTTYRALLEEARRARAERLLAATSRTLDEIAAELGYADVPSFSRAFRRWTGRPPAEWRKIH